MPYSNATSREMSRKRRNEMTAEEIQNARQQAHDRYVRRRDQETPEQREERNKRRREEYHQRRSRLGRGRGQSRGARNHEIEPLQIHLAPVTIPNECAQELNQCAMNSNQEEQMQRRRQEALLKRPWVADANNEAGPSKRTCEIKEMHEENVNNNSHADSF
eukprot:Gb_30680 [translate_table: standard]